MRKQNLPSDHWIEFFADWLDYPGIIEEKLTAKRQVVAQFENPTPKISLQDSLKRS
jgi:hypothetical protein